MAVATLRKIDEFDLNKEEWPQYVERLGHFFSANDINSPEKKRAVFLAVVGPAMYGLLHNLIWPDKPGDKTRYWWKSECKISALLRKRQYRDLSSIPA